MACIRFVLAGAVVAIALVASSDRAANPPPTSQPAVDPVPILATSPERGTKSTAVPIPYRPYIPPAIAAREPRLLPHDGQRPLKPAKSVDLPTVADVGLRDLPASPRLAVGPPISIPSPSAADIPVAVIAAFPDLARTTLQTDPTQNAGAPAALLLVPPPRTVSAPFLLLVIPDPARQAGYVPENQSNNEGAPAIDIDRPAVALLHVDAK